VYRRQEKGIDPSIAATQAHQLTRMLINISVVDPDTLA
jgi:hypothetical protein